MAYVAVSGGQEAIEESIRLLHCMRGSTFKELEVEAIEKKLGLLVDRVMSESGLYAPAYAALALKQAEGSIEEAVFLLRAYRSTLSRNYYTCRPAGQRCALSAGSRQPLRIFRADRFWERPMIIHIG